MREQWFNRLGNKTRSAIPADQTEVTSLAQNDPSPRSASTKAGHGEHDCAGLNMLDDLLALLMDRHDQPVKEWRQIIRRMVLDRMFTDHTGDSIAQHDAPTMDFQTDLIVHVLEEARQNAMTQGQWSDQPSPPLMCG
jgi:hypothetical protein